MEVAEIIQTETHRWTISTIVILDQNPAAQKRGKFQTIRDTLLYISCQLKTHIGRTIRGIKPAFV